MMPRASGPFRTVAPTEGVTHLAQAVEAAIRGMGAGTATLETETEMIPPAPETKIPEMGAESPDTGVTNQVRVATNQVMGAASQAMVTVNPVKAVVTAVARATTATAKAITGVEKVAMGKATPVVAKATAARETMAAGTARKVRAPVGETTPIKTKTDPSGFLLVHQDQKAVDTPPFFTKPSGGLLFSGRFS